MGNEAISATLSQYGQVLNSKHETWGEAMPYPVSTVANSSDNPSYTPEEPVAKIPSESPAGGVDEQDSLIDSLQPNRIPAAEKSKHDEGHKNKKPKFQWNEEEEKELGGKRLMENWQWNNPRENSYPLGLSRRSPSIT
ncbi:hypothetical protein JTB14_034998 [Gonioctena quinquepunctata]|nr:hypothetical protein JTB14_034998 [Gonioctena quinquepunctata]